MESLSALVQQLDKSQAADKLMTKNDFESLDNFHAITYAVTVNTSDQSNATHVLRTDRSTSTAIRHELGRDMPCTYDVAV